ncbi:unnamed protein product [Paramecium primaurelia]|uniref:Zinc-finger domain-containing protein n=1 Tax=Paramecium primaurelia TaxID=5886 RepID=A0A8S1LQ05_PARPR|nr:unnamed protein product [Paramecium primaurelia]
MHTQNNFMYNTQGYMYPQQYMYPHPHQHQPPNYVFPQSIQPPQFYYMNPQNPAMYQYNIGQQQQQQQQQRIKCNQPKTKEQELKQQKQQVVKQQSNQNIQQQIEMKKTNLKILTEQQIKDQVGSITKQGFCHYCNKNGKMCYYCFSNYRSTDCRHGFCFDCLMFKFKINPIKILLRPDWSCPIKCKQCNCSRCTNLNQMDSDQLISNDSVESCNKYAHIIENTKKIKKQYQKKKNIIREMFQVKFQQLDPKKKKQQQSMKKTLLLNKIKKQMQFSQECILKLKQKHIQNDEQILHQVVRYNFGSLIDLFKEYKSS